MAQNKATLERDVSGQPVQALAPLDTAVVSGTTTVTAQRSTLPVYDFIELTVTEASYVAYGDVTVVATTASRIAMPGSYVHVLLNPGVVHSHISVLQVAAAGAFTVTPLV